MGIIQKIVEKIISFLKLLFRRNKIADLVPSLKNVNTEKVFSGIQPGDIIFATTFQTYEELRKVAEGHRLRPMIVAKKDNEYVYAFSGSSKNKHYRITFVMDGKKYKIGKNGIFKNGYVNLARIQKVPKKNILSKKGQLTLHDQLKINDLIWNKTHNSNMQYIEFHYHLQEGQIVRKDNELFYLAKVKENTGVVYKMYCNSNGFNDIQIPVGNHAYTVGITKSEVNLNELVPTSIIEKGIMFRLKAMEKQTKRTKQEKKQQIISLYRNHFYRYSSGSVFIMNFVPYIYLFSNGDHDYGVRKYSEDEAHDFLNLEKMDHLDIFHEKGIISDEELFDTVQELICYHSQYEWLLDELFVLE